MCLQEKFLNVTSDNLTLYEILEFCPMSVKIFFISNLIFLIDPYFEGYYSGGGSRRASPRDEQRLILAGQRLDSAGRCLDPLRFPNTKQQYPIRESAVERRKKKWRGRNQSAF
jgi:hypothetical protein